MPSPCIPDPVYPMDLLRDHGHMKHHIGQPKLETNDPIFNQLVEENQLWKSKIKFSNRKGFINGLINTPGKPCTKLFFNLSVVADTSSDKNNACCIPATLAINSDTLQIIDHSEFCWVLGRLSNVPTLPMIQSSNWFWRAQ